MAYPYGATNAVSFGPFSASSSQQPSSIAIGASAGRKNQGPNAIAIGTLAGQLNQNQSTIVLNATGTALDTTNDNAVYMAPMRFVTASNVMTYNSTSKEVSYTDTVSSLTISSLSTRALAGSTLSISSITAGSVGYSTLVGSSLSANSITLYNSSIALGLSTTSTNVNFSQGSYAADSWIAAKTGLVNPRKLATSSTGQYQLVTSGGLDIWLSSDSGSTWSQLNSNTGLPTLSGSAYWSSGTISASGQYILLAVYGGSLWMSQDYGRTFALTNQTTPNIWLQLNGNVNDTMGGAAATATGSPAYITYNRPGYSAQAINLANTASGTATKYVRGSWAGATNFTVSFWMNPQIVNSNYQVAFSAYTGAIAVYIHTTNVIMFQYPTGGTSGLATINGPTMIANTWYFISITFQSNNTCSFYVNNMPIGTVVNVGGFGTYTSSGNYALGTYDNATTQAFNGYIADFRLYNSAITYTPIPHVAPNIWLPFENNTNNLGSNADAYPNIWLPFDGSTADSTGTSTITPTGSFTYVSPARPGITGSQAIFLNNTLGSGATATQYVRGTWNNGSAWTVSFWFNMQSYNTTQGQSILFGAASGALLIIIYNTSLSVWAYSGGTSATRISTSAIPFTNTWYHVSYIHQDGGTCSLYLNGSLVGSFNQTGAGIGTSGYFALGTYDVPTYSSPFNGYIDDFRLYNAAINYNPAGFVSGSVSYVPGVVGLNAVNLVNAAGGTATNYIRAAWPGASNFTVSFWMNPQTLPTGTSIVVWSSYSDGNTLWIENSTNRISYSFSNNNSNSTKSVVFGPSVSINTWYHVYVIFQSSGTVSFYVNGALVGYGTNTGGIYSGWTNTGLFGLGTFDFQATNAFNGYIDDFRLYNAAIPYHVLAPQNFRAVALSGNAQYSLASAASGWVVGAADTGKTWTKQAVNVGTQGDLIQPNLTGLAQSTWSQNGVNWTASASSVVNGLYPPYGAFNITVGGANNQWACSSSTYTTSGNTSGITTVVGGGVGTITGEWIQLQATIPMILASYQLASGSDSNVYLPKSFYIVGSNDGSTWLPIQYAVGVSVPTGSTSTLIPGNIIVNSSNVQPWGNSTITTTAYTTSIQPYYYFRMIFVSTFTTGSPNVVELGELYLNFAKPSPNNLALSYSGQYQLVATNTAAGQIMPNQSGLATATWTQGGVQWTATASSIYPSGTLLPYGAFNNTSNNLIGNYSWASAVNMYDGTTGAYLGSVSTTILGGIGAQSGEWIQIQSSVPLVLQTYTYGCGNFINLPKTYYIVGSNDGSNWYPLQYVAMTTNPLTGNFHVCTSYITINTNGSFTISGDTTGAGTSTAYSYTTQAWSYFRLISTTVWTTANLTEIGELYLNFSNSVSYSSNYGATWSNTANTASNEIVALSPSGQVALSTNAVVPYARLTLDNTNVDAQGALTPATGAGTVTYSSSIVKVGTQSAYFANTAGGTTGITYLNYTVPTVLNMPSALTMGCWVYPTSINGAYHSYVVSLCIPSQYGVHLRLTGGTRELCAYIGNQSYTVTTGQFVPLNTWSHIALTYTNYVLSVYYNGVFSNSGTLTKNPAAVGDAAMTNFYVGCSIPDNQAFAGYVDDVRIYTSALSADGIASIYANPNLSQTIGVSSSYLPITTYTKPVLPGATANVVDAKVSQTGQYMVAVTSATSNNVYYSTDSGATFTGLSIGSSPMVACSISYDGSYLTATNTTGTVYTLNKNSNTYTLALGNQAGAVNQASNSIAIGNQAGYLNQSANSIVLNASGAPITATNAGFYVSPVATTSGLSMELLGYGADSQIVKTGVTVLPGGSLYNPTVWNSITLLQDSSSSWPFFLKYTSGPQVVIGSGGFANAIVIDTYNYILNNRPPLILNISGGLVGIGTSAPSQLLTIFGTGTPALLIKSNSGGTSGNTASIYLSNVAYNMGTIQSIERANGYGGTWGADMTFSTHYNVVMYERMRITATGNVGIGTNAPAVKLDVRGVIWGDGINSILNGSTSTYGYVSLVPGTTNNTGYIEFRRPGTTRDAYIGFCDTSNFYFNVEQSRNLIFYTNGIPRMTILSGGFVGIGTDGAPYSETIFRVKTPNAAGVSAIFGGTSGKDIYMYTDSTTGWVGGNSTLGFYAGNSTSNYMTLDTSGRLGIGGAPYQKVYVKTSGTQVGGPTSWSTTDGISVGIASTQTANTTAICMNLMDGGYPGNSAQYIGAITCLTPNSQWNNIHIYAATTYVYYFGAMAAYTSTGQWVNASDEREKYDIQDLKTESSLKRILSVKPKHYKRKFYDKDIPIPDSIKEERHIGFIAQQIHSSNPHCISTWDNSSNIENKEEDDGIRLGVNYNDYIVHLCGAVQEQQKMIDTQATTISEQRQLIENLTTNFDKLVKWARTKGYSG